MDKISVQTILLSILTSIITGGFILVFVEIGNRKNRENDRHDQIMRPFMHKLSAYFRFLSWCSHYIIYPKQLNENEQGFKNLVEEIGRYGTRLIMSGGDYDIGYFTANELNNICFKINNIWYYHDKMIPCILKWKEDCVSQDFISKELKEFFPNYLSNIRNITLVSNISGEFYTDIYQPIENETYLHEAYIEHFKRQTIFVALAVGFVLIALLTMLFVELQVCIMQFLGIFVVMLLVISLLLLGIDTRAQIQYFNRYYNFFINMRNCNAFKMFSQIFLDIASMKSFRFILYSIISIASLLAIWAILSIEVELLPKIPVFWDESIILGLNRLFLNLSYSYITGVIVYCFVVKFPELRNKLK